MVVSLEIRGRVARSARVGMAAPAPAHDGVRPGEPSALVVCGDAESRRRLRGALVLAGWHDQSAAIDVDDLGALARRHHPLVVVDLVHPLLAADAGSRRTVETIARRPGTLLVTCGDPDSAEHEAWARAQGAFCHPAGAVSSAALVAVLEQARAVVERLSPSIAPAA